MRKHQLFKSVITLAGVVLLAPALSFAQPNFSYFNAEGGNGLLQQLESLISNLIPVVIALGLLAFIWGVVTFIFASGNEDAKEEGKRKMIWGIIALFAIVSVWGLVGLLNQLTGIQQGGTAVIPDVDFN